MKYEKYIKRASRNLAEKMFHNGPNIMLDDHGNTITFFYLPPKYHMLYSSGNTPGKCPGRPFGMKISIGGGNVSLSELESTIYVDWLGTTSFRYNPCSGFCIMCDSDQTYYTPTNHDTSYDKICHGCGHEWD